MAIAQLQKFYPKWIPYPSSWLRALLLILVLGPLGSLISLLGLWGSLVTVLAGSIGAITLPGVCICLAIAAAALLIPTTVLAYVYHILTLIFDAKSLSAKHPRGFPTWESWREGLTGVIVMGIGISIAFAVLFWYYPHVLALVDRDLLTETQIIVWKSYRYRVFEYDVLTRAAQEAIVTFWGTVWLISAAYLYQWDYLARQKRDRQQKRQKALAENISQAKKPIRSEVDPVNVDLNKLRGEMGLHKIKTYPTKKPDRK